LDGIEIKGGNREQFKDCRRPRFYNVVWFEKVTCLWHKKFLHHCLGQHLQ